MVAVARRASASLFAAALLASCATAADLSGTERTENDVRLYGLITGKMAEAPYPLDEFEAAVCGMKHRSSTLSVRSAPKTSAKELAQAPYYAIVSFTGKRSADNAWVEISSISRRVDVDGRFLERDAQTSTSVTGWVSTRYLCDFEM